VDDIYFIIGLSCRGEMVNIKARGARGGRNMEEYIATYCVADTEKVGSQLPIRVIENLSLKIFILVLTDYKLNRMRNFRFASILCIFFFERVLAMIPRK
jgi:hypothetical protein